MATKYWISTNCYRVLKKRGRRIKDLENTLSLFLPIKCYPTGGYVSIYMHKSQGKKLLILPPSFEMLPTLDLEMESTLVGSKKKRKDISVEEMV